MKNLRISRVLLKNYGVFQDVELDFGQNAKGVSFINGNNGRGKTTLLDALKWAIYGVGEPRVARSTLRSASESAEIEVAVEISFETADGESAKVRRSQLFRSRGDSQNPVSLTQPDLEIKTTTQNPLDGTTVQINPQNWLSKRLPERFMNFVLFDGEQMTKFFDLRTRAAIQEAVLEIAGVESLDRVIEIYTSIKEALERSRAKNSGDDVKKLQEELEKRRTFAKLLAEEISRDKNRRDEIDVRVEDIENSLGETKNLEPKIDRLRELKPQIETALAVVADAEKGLFAAVRNSGPLFLLSASFKKTSEEVKRAELEGWLPTDFDPNSLRKLLESGNCICGCDLASSKTHYKAISQMIEGISQSDALGKILQNVWGEIQKTEVRLNDLNKFALSANDNYRAALRQLSTLKDAQAELENDLYGLDQKLVSDLTAERKALLAEKEELIRDSVGQERDAEKASQDILKKQGEIKKALESSGKIADDQKLIDAADELITTANYVRHKAVADVRLALENAMGKDLNNIKQGHYKVVISEDFNIFVNLSDGEPISEGEQMLLAYSFAMALRSVLNMEFPLIVDTPFGRLDNPNRTWLSQSLVQLVAGDQGNSLEKQAVFFMHDAEYTPYTMDNFAPASPLVVFLDHEPAIKITEIKPGIDPNWFTYPGPWADWKKVN